jgi:hypothetical protein
VILLEWPEDGQIEYCAQVDEEAFSPLPGKDLPATRELVDRGCRQSGVVRRREGSDVARWASEVAA